MIKEEVLPLPAPDHIRRIRTRHHNIILDIIHRGNRPAPIAHGASALRPGPVDRRVKIRRRVEVVPVEVQLGGQEVGPAVAGGVVEGVTVVGLGLRPVLQGEDGGGGAAWGREGIWRFLGCAEEG